MRFLFIAFLVFIQFNLISRDTLTVGYTNSAPFIYEENGKLQGPIFWLWSNIVEQNDFAVRYKAIASEKIVSDLAGGEVDLMLYPMTITSNRAEKIDFSPPFYLAYSGVAANQFSTWQKAKLFLSSFLSFDFLKALIGLSLIILIFGFLTWLFERKYNHEEFGGGVRGLWSGFWWSAVTMTTVGYGDKSPKTTGGRIVALFWMFTAIIIISGFTASITSSLTVTELETDMSRIDNFKLKKLVTVQNSGTVDWLTDNFYNNQLLVPTKEALIPALRDQKADAIVYDLPLLNDMMKTDTLNEFTLLPIRFNPQYYALGMNPSVADSVQKLINTALLSNTERLDWDVVLGEYGLNIN